MEDLCECHVPVWYAHISYIYLFKEFSKIYNIMSKSIQNPYIVQNAVLLKNSLWTFLKDNNTCGVLVM